MGALLDEMPSQISEELEDIMEKEQWSWNKSITLFIFGEYLLWNLCLALSSSLMCLTLAPRAVGSGIPEMIAYLNGVRVERFTSFYLFLVKIVGTILSVSSGLAIGPEGPLVHLGAIMGASLTKVGRFERHVWSLRRKCPMVAGLLGCAEFREEMCVEVEGDCEGGLKKEGEMQDCDRRSWYCCLCQNTIITQIIDQLSPLRNDAERRDLISIGAACGFASAFGAPIGGLLFSMEEASTFFAHPLLFKTLVCTAIATFCLTMYRGNLSEYGVITLAPLEGTLNGEIFLNRFTEIPLYAAWGAVGGLSGAFFNHLWESMFHMRQGFFKRQKVSPIGRIIEKLTEVGLLSIITSILTFALPMLMRQYTCKNPDSTVAIKMLLVDEESDLSEHRFGCGKNQIDELGVILFGSRESAIKFILTDPTMFEPATLLSVGLLFFPLMTLTFGVNIPSGIFMPTMLVGASLGGVACIALNSALDLGLNSSTYALLGAAALLSGIQRSTVSLCVILLEGTGQTKILIPVIITVVVARYVGDFFNHGIYEMAIEAKGYPYLDHHIKKSYDVYKVKDVMSSPALTMNSVETARNVELMLKQTGHHGFPVVDANTKKFLGLVRRDQLVALLECGIFTETSTTLMKDLTRKSFKAESMLALTIRDDRYHKFPSFISSSGGASESSIKLETIDDDTVRDDILDNEFDEYSWLMDNVQETNRNSLVITGDDALPTGSISKSNETTVYSDHGKLIVKLDEAHYSKNVDIAAVMNQGAYCVAAGLPLSKAYTMFTTLGLRHLVVLGGKDGGEVVGVLTRMNFTPDYIESHAGDINRLD